MEINPASRKIDASDLPLDRLVTSNQLSKAEKINAVSHHFEAILLRQFLTEAQKPLLKSKDGLLGASNAIYQDMIVGNMADEISKTGMLGLASAFQTQMGPAHKAGAEKGGGDVANE